MPALRAMEKVTASARYLPLNHMPWRISSISSVTLSAFSNCFVLTHPSIKLLEITLLGSVKAFLVICSYKSRAFLMCPAFELGTVLQSVEEDGLGRKKKK